MELDHVFIFTGWPQQVASSLRQFGLTEGSPNTHPGQGTACKRFFFKNAYLELVWVTSQKEIKSPVVAETKLWERSQYNTTAYCPFGLCFRSQNPTNSSPIALLFEDAWHYKPDYLPDGFYVNVASTTPAEPMLFEMPFFGITPNDYPAEKRQPLTHQIGFKEITNVLLRLPTGVNDVSPSMQNVISQSNVAVSEGNYAVTVEFDHGKKQQSHDFSPLLPLTITW